MCYCGGWFLREWGLTVAGAALAVEQQTRARREYAERPHDNRHGCDPYTRVKLFGAQQQVATQFYNTHIQTLPIPEDPIGIL